MAESEFETTEWNIPGNQAALKNLMRLFAQQRPVVAFVGAGASAGICPPWTRFLELMIECAEEKGRLSEDDKASLDANDIYSSASQLKSKLAHHYCEFMRNTFDVSRECPRNCTDVHRAIMALPFHAIITTNYDDGLVNAAKQIGKDVTSATLKDPELTYWIEGNIYQERDGTTPILFAHGKFNRCNTLVLTFEDYQEVYDGRGPMRRVFDRAMKQAHLVFIGFSFSDRWVAEMCRRSVGDLPREQRDVRHFAMISVDNPKKVNAAYRDGFNRHYRLEPICFPVTGTGNNRDYSNLLVLLRRLARPRFQSNECTDLRSDLGEHLLSCLNASTGGAYWRPATPEDGTQAWATAQVGVAMSCYPDIEPERFDRVLSYLRSTRTALGWKYFEDHPGDPIANATAYAVLAKLRIYRRLGTIANPEVLAELTEDIDILMRFQSSTGGCVPILKDITGSGGPRKEAVPAWARTYTTTITAWALAEAAALPFPDPAFKSDIAAALKLAVEWLIKARTPQFGWVPAPRIPDRRSYPGLTAQVIYVLSQVAPTLEDAQRNQIDAVLRESVWLCDQKWQGTATESDPPNSAILGPNEVVEAMTYHWFPWTLLVLTALASNQKIPPLDRERCISLRAELLSHCAETAAELFSGQTEFAYVWAEHAFSLCTAMQ